MERHRGRNVFWPYSRSRPACEAMDIDKRFDGVDLCAEGPLCWALP